MRRRIRPQGDARSASSAIESTPNPLSQRAKTEAPTVATVAGVDNTRYMPPAGQPSLDILESLSKMPASVVINRSEYLIGRSSTVDLAFTDDPTVSRIHATIVQDGKIYRIFDEQSTSGTYINDKQVPEYGLQLANGDEIHMGAVHLRFRQ
jgi:pSer/pThr/pTyr-binding forkhead associated (FHA) protein